jgi:hypothetical protein
MLETPGCGRVQFKIDTGADINVMSKSCYDSMVKKPPLQPSRTKIFGFGNQPVQAVGCIELPCVYKQRKYVISCEVVQARVPNVLSLNDSVRLNLVRRVDQVQKLPMSIEKCKYPSSQKVIEEYIDVFQGVGKVPGKVALKINKDITPVAHPPRPIPLALREPVKKKLQNLVDTDIIEKIPVGVPTPWCSNLHVVPKKENDVRLTIDPKDLNNALQREYHPTTTVEDIMQRCGKAKYFTVLDANQGYFQLELEETSRAYTAFNTPFGRYQYKRLPMGITTAPELFQRIFGDIFEAIDGTYIIMDDFLIAAETIEQHDKILKETLQRARDNHVTFSLNKLQLCTNSVKYSGHKFTDKGVQMDEDKIQAVLKMPTPQSVQEIQTLLGMATYVCRYLKNLSSITEPLRSVIKGKDEYGFHWDKPQEESFQLLKKTMSEAPVLQYYEMHKPVTISCDASQSGLGCVVLQDGLPVAYGSKALTTAECAYAQIEKEMLAIVYSLKKFHTYVYGRYDVTIETDHLPLLRIFEKPLYLVPLRLQKMRMKVQGYDFKLVHKKGTEIPVADALSRAFVTDTGPNLTGDSNSHIFEASIDEVNSLKQVSPARLAEIRRCTLKDVTLQAVTKAIMEGWPSHRQNADPLTRPYFDCQEDLCVIDGIIYKGQRIVVPAKMRKDALSMLHTGHQGIVKTKQLARDLIYWPGLNKEIEELVSTCGQCQENRNMQTREPLMPMPIPDRPWEHIAEDIFYCLGHTWLICIDYYSEYFEIAKMENGTHAEEVILQNKRWFCTHGIPDRLTSDNGPPFNSVLWKDFADSYGFVHTPTSPLHPQANGMVEKAVAIAKAMLIKCHDSNSDPYMALLNLRNTPRDDQTGSPAQRLFSRRTRTRIPITNDKLKPIVMNPDVVANKLREDRHKRAKKYFDRGSKELKPLREGDTVRIRAGKKWLPAFLPQQVTSSPRSYDVKLPSGIVSRRNRRDLLKTKEGNIYREDVQEEDDEPPMRQDDVDGTPHLNVPQSPINPNIPQIPVPNVPNNSTPRPQVTTRSGRTSRPPPYLNNYVRY